MTPPQPIGGEGRFEPAAGQGEEGHAEEDMLPLTQVTLTLTRTLTLTLTRTLTLAFTVTLTLTLTLTTHLSP